MEDTPKSLSPGDGRSVEARHWKRTFSEISEDYERGSGSKPDRPITRRIKRAAPLPLTSSRMDAVAPAGTAAGPANDWVPPGDSRVIASTRLLDPGTTGEVTFTAPAPGTYQFVCTFPGHNLTMFGNFVVN